MKTMTNGVTITVLSTGKTYHTRKDCGLAIGNNNCIGQPEQETYYLDVPGADGFLDYSEALTGRPIFKKRSIEINLGGKMERTKWTAFVSDIRILLHESLIKLCVDICQRNGKTKLLWLGDKDTTLNYSPKSDEMILTVHRWFANKSCPGNWLYARMDDLATKVTAALGGATTETPSVSAPTTDATKKEVYRVRKTWADAKSQVGAYRVLKNAKAAADKNPDTFVFDSTGTAIYPETYRIHTVVHGDTLWKIAAQYLESGSRYKEIVQLNELTSNVIYSGTKLKIPN